MKVIEWLMGNDTGISSKAMVSERIGKNYHTGEIRTEAEAQRVYHVALSIRQTTTGSGSHAPEVGTP